VRVISSESLEAERQALGLIQVLKQCEPAVDKQLRVVAGFWARSLRIATVEVSQVTRLIREMVLGAVGFDLSAFAPGNMSDKSGALWKHLRDDLQPLGAQDWSLLSCLGFASPRT
jgi:hypothetical protein